MTTVRMLVIARWGFISQVELDPETCLNEARDEIKAGARELVLGIDDGYNPPDPFWSWRQPVVIVDYIAPREARGLR